MGVVIKQSFWISVIGYLGVIVGYVNTIILRPEFMSIDEIGLMNLVISNAVMFAPVVSLGMPGAYIRLVHYVQENKIEKERLFTFQLMVLIVANLVLMVLAWLLLPWIKSAFLENSPAYNEYIFVSLYILLFYSLFLQLNAFSRVELNVTLTEFLKNVFLRIGNGALIILYGLGWINLDLAIKLLIVVYFLAFAVNLFYIYQKYHFRLSARIFSFSQGLKKEMFRFGSTLIVVSIASTIATQIFFLLVSTMVGLGANGIFTTCFFIATVIEMPKRSMMQILVPIFAKEFKKNNLLEIAKLYQKSSITLGVFAMLLFLGIVGNLNDLFLLIPNGSEFKEGILVVVLVSGAKVVDMIFGFNSELINYSKDYRYLIIFSVLYAVLTLTFCFTLIPVYGMNGAALAYFMSMVVFNIAKFVFLKFRFGLSPFTHRHIYLLVITAVVYVTAIYIPFHFSAIINILLRSVIITVIFSISVYSLKISSDINNLARKIVNRVLNL